MDKLRFGTAGIPLLTPKHGTLTGIEYLRKLNLDCMELEFVRSVNISETLAKEVKTAAKKHNIALTCHGQYFINLNSQEQEKIEASKQRIFNAAKRAWQCGAMSMTFHAAYYMKEEPQKVYQKVLEGVKEVIIKLHEENINITIRPETTGKPSQWGNLKEIIKILY